MTRIVVSVPGVTFDNMLFGDGWQLGELEGWWGTTKPRIVSDARPEWHGDFGQDEVYLEPRFVTVSGVFQSRENPDLVTSARDTLAALHEAGEFEFTVSDGAVGRVTARMASELVWDVDYAPGCASFEFTVKADDPRRYGLGQSFSTGVPTQGVGVADPVVDPVQEGGVLVPVATNLFTNSRLVGDGTWAEVARFPTGSTPPTFAQPEDFRVRDLGTGESVMEIERVRGLTATNCVAGVSTKAGKPAARLIPTSSLTTSFASLPISTAAQANGTFAATSHIDAALPLPLDRRRGSIDVSSPQTDSPYRVNTAGAEPLRQVFSGQSSSASARLWHGGSLGSGDVWWTDIGLYAGDYAGEAFNGSTPPETIGDASYTHQWDGSIDASTSTRYWIDPGTPGNPGRVALTNTGTAPSEPMVRVTGGLSEGFELLCIETGDVVRVTRPTPDGSVIDVDMGAGQVWIDQQSPLSAMYVPVAEWFSVKPGHTCTIQFTPLGVVTGTPTMSVEFAEASW